MTLPAARLGGGLSEPPCLIEAFGGGDKRLDSERFVVMSRPAGKACLGERMPALVPWDELE